MHFSKQLQDIPLADVHVVDGPLQLTSFYWDLFVIYSVFLSKDH